jgi:glycosyltransferase involved in cell wall biosynthesis
MDREYMYNRKIRDVTEIAPDPEMHRMATFSNFLHDLPEACSLEDPAREGSRFAPGSPPEQATTRPTVTVVLPAKNEAMNLPVVAERMPPVDEIVLVDGGSVDGTADVARRLWPDAVVIEQTRRGKGNALACGFLAASGDIIVMIDGDCSTDPAEIPLFVEALVGGADLAKGTRFAEGGGSDDITRFRRFGNRGLNGLVNRVFSTGFSDLCYGYNAFWRRNLNGLDLPCIEALAAQWGDGFEIETVINVRAARNGWLIREVGSFEGRRMYGRSNLNAVTDGMRVLRTIRREHREHRARHTVGATGRMR